MMEWEEIDDRSVSDDRTWIGFVMGLWLTGVFAGSLFGWSQGKRAHLYEATMLVSLLWPTAYFACSRYRFVPTGFSSGTIIGMALFALFCGLSSFVSRAPLESTQYTVLTILTALVVLQFTTNLDAAQYEVGLATYAVLMAVLVSGFAVYDYVPGHRLGGGKEVLNPASFALVTLSVFIAAMAIRWVAIRIPILLSMGLVIYLTGARASAVAALFGLTVTLVSRRRATEASGYLLLALCTALGLAVAAYYGQSVVRGVSEFFAVQDPHRGLESGGSGRLETWKVMWSVFLSNPLLGVGFRAHEAVLKVSTSAHNGYLALLAEIGVIGFAATMFVAFTGLWRLWCRSRIVPQSFSYSVLFGLACGYFVLALFERYFINAGNPTSLLFLLGILGPSLSPDESPETSWLEPMYDDYDENEVDEFGTKPVP